LSLEITDLRKSLQGRHRKSRSKQGFLAWCQTQASRGGPAGSEAERFIGCANNRKRLLYRAKARTDVALGILSESVADADGRAIVFHESIEEIETLFLKTEEMRLPAVLEHSKLPDSLRADNIDAFRRGIARVIISAKSLVEGFNVPSADLGIIAASSGSVRQRIQSLGRMLRRKAGDRSARIIVLYVRDTEDEAIYEKADWETIVGAERNRYFLWNASLGLPWTQGLQETSKPPRTYRPPSWEIDVDDLSSGDPYPGHPSGLDLRVDQSGNLRTDDGTLVPVPPQFIALIVDRNPHRRARRTPAGHLIVRVDPKGSDEADWRFLGSINLPDERCLNAVTMLRLKNSSGKRVIALEQESRKGVHFALGDDTFSTVRTLHGKRVSVGECGSQGANLYVPAHYRYKVGFAPIFAYEGVQEHAKVRGGLFRLASVHQFSESLMSVFHQPYSFCFHCGSTNFGGLPFGGGKERRERQRACSKRRSIGQKKTSSVWKLSGGSVRGERFFGMH